MKLPAAGLRLLLCCVGGVVCAAGEPPAYRAEMHPTGTLRVWGSAQMTELVERSEKGFARFHPDITFHNHLYGAASAIGGLYSGVADIVVSREIQPSETLAFEQVMGYPPLAIDIATGSFDVPTKSSSLDILVRRENPVTGLTFAQLARIFGSGGHRLTWGDFGVQGSLRDQPIHPYGYKVDNAGAQLFASLIFAKNRLWNCDYQGFENLESPGTKRIDAGRQVVEALARDPLGIALSNLHYATDAVRAVAIAAGDSGPWIMPTRDSVAGRTYPLFRHVYLFLNRNPRKPADAKCREFVRYLLSREGQLDIASEQAYLPLPPALAAESLNTLRTTM